MFLHFSHAIICFILSSFILRRSDALTLSSGQRITSRSLQTDLNRFREEPGGPFSLFDLPSVELWGEARGLKEHYLKILYRVLMNPSAVPVLENSECYFLVENNWKGRLEEKLTTAGFPKKYSQDLLSNFSITCSIQRIEKSEGGYKFVIQVPSGKFVETVLIRHERHNGDVRYTVCVSSQVGCAKKCSFCATGTMGLQGQLSSAEILEQVFLAKSYLNAAMSHGVLRNCVFMGMGEPLDNYEAVHEALRGLTHQCLFALKAKQVTVSTVGANASKIMQLADEAPQVSLALSLHSSVQSTREALIPSAKMSPIDILGRALDYHSDKSGRGAMLEYLLIDGVNDSDTEMETLAKFCLERRGSVFVNLIPYNPTLAGENYGYNFPSDERIYAFHDRLRELGVKSLIRWSSANGRDANGACGQLALTSNHKTIKNE
jgi:Predicted Fe-S-cluster redox enzyme